MKTFEEESKERERLTGKSFMPNIPSGQTFDGQMSTEELEDRFTLAKNYYAEFLKALGYDIDNDPNMKETPQRVVKIWMKELMRGTYESMPKITQFENRIGYDGMVFQGNITLRSSCSHHNAMILGRVHVAYLPAPDGKVIGLSKINRIVDWIGRRPQLQEQMTQQILDTLDTLLPGNRGIAVYIEGHHTCVSMRGIEDQNSKMCTARMSGCFLDNEDNARSEFYSMVERLPKL